MSDIKRTNSEFNRQAAGAMRVPARAETGIYTETWTQTSRAFDLRLIDPDKVAGRDPYNSVGVRARGRPVG